MMMNGKDGTIFINSVNLLFPFDSLFW